MEWMNIFDNEFVCICQREKRQRRFSKKKKKHASHCKLWIQHWRDTALGMFGSQKRGDNNTSMFVNKKKGR